MKFNKIKRLYWSEISDPHEYFGSTTYWRIHRSYIRFNIKTIAKCKSKIYAVPFSHHKMKVLRPFSKRRVYYPMWFGFYKPDMQRAIYGEVGL